MSWFVVQRLPGGDTIRFTNATRQDAIDLACDMLGRGHDVVHIRGYVYTRGAESAAAEMISGDRIRRIFDARQVAADPPVGTPFQRRVRALRNCGRGLLRKGYVLCRVAADTRVPWLARIVAIGSALYLLSPIDLIFDKLPVIGYLDDIVVVGIGFAIAKSLVLPAIIAEYHAQARCKFPRVAA